MRQTILIVIVAAALCAVGCQRKDQSPKPTISMGLTVPMMPMAEVGGINSGGVVRVI